jgi:general transcription factor 3C polypeptide 5 (transcription factor C subunit 1)
MPGCAFYCPLLRLASDANYSYQRLYFRNANHPILKPSVMTRRQDRTAANMDNWAVAIEDGSERDNDRR